MFKIPKSGWWLHGAGSVAPCIHFLAGFHLGAFAPKFLTGLPKQDNHTLVPCQAGNSSAWEQLLGRSSKGWSKLSDSHRQVVYSCKSITDCESMHNTTCNKIYPGRPAMGTAMTRNKILSGSMPT